MSPTETADAKNTVDAKNNKDGVKREISVEVPAEEVTRETEAIILKYQKVARLPGFRKGHVPASMIRHRFAEDLKSDVVEALVPRYFRKEAEKLGMIPVSQPRVTELHIHDGEPLTFKASFEVMPEIRVEGYKELRAEHPEITVTDEDVEQALASVRSSMPRSLRSREGRWPTATLRKPRLTASRRMAPKTAQRTQQSTARRATPIPCTWTKC